jgi:hypothetical protein
MAPSDLLFLFVLLVIESCNCGMITYSLIWQATPYPGISNQITAIFMTNTNLQSADGAFVNISGLTGTQGEYALPIKIVCPTCDYFSASKLMFCSHPPTVAGGADFGLFDSKSGTLLFWICPGRTLLKSTNYSLSFNLQNPFSEQPSPRISIQAGWPGKLETELMFKNGSHLYWPLETVAPRFVECNMSQRSPLILTENSLTAEFKINFDMKSSDRWIVTLSGLKGMTASADLQFSLSDAGPFFCLRGAKGQGIWNISTRTIVLTLCNNISIPENTIFRLFVNVTNLEVVQTAPNIGIEATGVSRIPFTPFNTPSIPSVFVTNDSKPLYLVAVIKLRSISSFWSYASGGSLLVSGSGLTLRYTNASGVVKRPSFLCIFDKLGLNLRTNAVVLNSTHLNCTVPRFTSAAQDVLFDVSMHLDSVSSSSTTDPVSSPSDTDLS